MWTKQETCPGPRLCNSFSWAEADRKAAGNDPELIHQWVKKWCSENGHPETWGMQPDGFYYCTNCRLIRRNQLIECPSCHKFFKGPRPDFPIDYECEKCQ